MCIFSVIPMGRLSVLSTPVSGRVTSHTRRVVILIVFSLKRLTEQLPNKWSNSWHGKLSFKSANNICVIRGTKRLGPEDNYFLSFEIHSYSYIHRSRGLYRKGRNFRLIDQWGARKDGAEGLEGSLTTGQALTITKDHGINNKHWIARSVDACYRCPSIIHEKLVR